MRLITSKSSQSRYHVYESLHVLVQTLRCFGSNCGPDDGTTQVHKSKRVEEDVVTQIVFLDVGSHAS